MKPRDLARLKELDRYFRHMADITRRFGGRDAFLEKPVYENALCMLVMRAGLLCAKLHGGAKDELERAAYLKSLIELSRKLAKGEVEDNLDAVWRWTETVRPKLAEHLTEMLEAEGR